MAQTGRKRLVPKYDWVFEQKLADTGILMDSRLSKAKGGVSVSDAGTGTPAISASFSSFVAMHINMMGKENIRANLVPYIAGETQIANSGGESFSGMRPLVTDLPPPRPDSFDGAPMGDVDKTVRETLAELIMPTHSKDGPPLLAPNFFLQVGDKTTTHEALKVQTAYEGAYGARAIHALQNYGKLEQTYDEKVYTYTATYHASAGLLHLYGHYLTKDGGPSGQPAYQMTKIKSYYMTGELANFNEGVASFRYLRNLAHQHRQRFISKANRRQRLAGAEEEEEEEDGEGEYGWDESNLMQ